MAYDTTTTTVVVVAAPAIVTVAVAGAAIIVNAVNNGNAVGGGGGAELMGLALSCATHEPLASAPISKKDYLQKCFIFLCTLGVLYIRILECDPLLTGMVPSKTFAFGLKTIRSKAGGYSAPFFISSPKRCMCVLYQAAIIWVLPIFSRIGKKIKKGEPSNLTFWGGKRWNLEPIFFTCFGSPTCL